MWLQFPFTWFQLSGVWNFYMHWESSRITSFLDGQYVMTVLCLEKSFYKVVEICLINSSGGNSSTFLPEGEKMKT